MSTAGIETYYFNSMWHNRRQGEAAPLSSHVTKEKAVAAGRLLAMEAKVEHVIKGVNGAIQERNSYGDDSYPPKG